MRHRHESGAPTDENGDRIEDRTKHNYQWHDGAYGVGAAPAIEITVRTHIDDEPDHVIYELTRAWMSVVRSIHDGGAPR